MKHPDIEKLKEQALLDRIAELEKRIEKLEKKANDKENIQSNHQLVHVGYHTINRTPILHGIQRNVGY